MKKSLMQFTAILLVILATACKKDTAPAPPLSAHANTPTCAYLNDEYRGGSWLRYLYFFDLSSPETANKKYFKLQLKYSGAIDSFEIEGTPQPIDNLSTGFPPEITVAPGFGGVNQWTNPQYRLLTTGASYYKDTIVRHPRSNIYFLYENFLSGSLAGKWPQSNFDHYKIPTGANGETVNYQRTIFYFQDGLCMHTGTYIPAIVPISSFYKGAPNYDWENVISGVQLGGTFYFLDFKNWRYFRWKQFMDNTFSPAQLATVFEDYQSLDKLCKWPEGWGKP